MRYVTNPAGVPVAPMSFDVARRRAMPEKFGTATFVNPNRVAEVTARLDALAEPNTTAWTALLAAYSLTRTPTGPDATDPYIIPGSVYTTPEENAAAVGAIRGDSVAAYNFALRYRLTGDEAAAEAALGHLEPWSEIVSFGTTGGNTRLGWSVHFPMMLAAAEMIADSAAHTTGFRDDMRALATLSLDVPGSLSRQNTTNQGDWSTFMVMCAGAYLRDQEVFDAACARWRAILNTSIDANGDLWQEIYREHGDIGNGISGIHYCFHAFNPKVYAAELARANGVWLFDYVTPNGHSLRTLWERLVPWLRYPETYPYNTSGEPSEAAELLGQDIGALEIAQALWPNDDGAAVLAAARPFTDRRGAPYTTVTHAGLLLRG